MHDVKILGYFEKKRYNIFTYGRVFFTPKMTCKFLLKNAPKQMPSLRKDVSVTENKHTLRLLQCVVRVTNV